MDGSSPCSSLQLYQLYIVYVSHISLALWVLGLVGGSHLYISSLPPAAGRVPCTRPFVVAQPCEAGSQMVDISSLRTGFLCMRLRWVRVAQASRPGWAKCASVHACCCPTQGLCTASLHGLACNSAKNDQQMVLVHMLKLTASRPARLPSQLAKKVSGFRFRQLAKLRKEAQFYVFQEQDQVSNRCTNCKPDGKSLTAKIL